MKKTPNLSLNKPDGTDVVNIEDLNANMDIIDTKFNAMGTNVTNHISAKSTAHAASTISCTVAGDMKAINVQGAIEELESEKLATSNVSTLAVANKIVQRNVNGKIAGDILGNSETATKLQTARTINGVAFDGSENIDITQVNGKDIATVDIIPTAGNKVAVLTGTITNGGTVPLPEGYTQEQCKWTVSHQQGMTGDYFVMKCAVNSNRVVTVNSDGDQTGYANYMIIGVKN